MHKSKKEDWLNLSIGESVGVNDYGMPGFKPVEIFDRPQTQMATGRIGLTKIHRFKRTAASKTAGNQSPDLQYGMSPGRSKY